MGGSVVVAVDGTADSKRALLWAMSTIAAEAAQGLRGAGADAGTKVHLVHVVKPREEFVIGGPGMHLVPRMPSREEEDEHLAKGHEVLAEAEALLREEQRRRGLEEPLQVSQHLLHGDPKERVVSLAGELGAGMLVVGRRGLTPFQKLCLGSVSDYCALKSTCPVACVPKSASV